MDWLIEKFKKFWKWLLFSGVVATVAIAQVIPNDTIPINIGTERATEILANRVVDFYQRGNVMHFAFFTDEIPTYYEGEDISLRLPHAWTKVSGLDRNGVQLGEFMDNGVKKVRTETNFSSLTRWRHQIGSRAPEDWRRIRYATTTRQHFDNSTARPSAFIWGLLGQSVYAQEFLSDAHPETDSFDGRCFNSASNWADTRSKDPCVSVNDTGDVETWVIDNTNDSKELQRVYLLFDTSSLSGTVESASLATVPNVVFDNEADAQSYITIGTSTPALKTGMSTADADQLWYIQNATTSSFGTLRDMGDDMTAEATSTWTIILPSTTFVMNDVIATGADTLCVATSGLTCLALAEGHDVEDLEPDCGCQAHSGANMYSAEDAGKEPTLTV